ncbi:MAG: hypothetical protein V1891_03135 [bacterium]
MKKILIIMIITGICYPLLAINYFAKATEPTLGEQITTETIKIAGPYAPGNVSLKKEQGKKNHLDIFKLAIGLITSFLGVIFFIQTIVAGIKWMTAGGNEEQITGAKQNIKNGVIGIAIVLAAYIITYFVFVQLTNVIGAQTGF